VEVSRGEATQRAAMLSSFADSLSLSCSCIARPSPNINHTPQACH
jgi:hypothetical protein